MLGAIIGDIIGSVYEANPVKSADFPLFGPGSRFTDDTVLSVAVARALLTDADYAGALKAFARRYPDAGYGGNFRHWAMSEGRGPYGSWGNGAAMRVSPIGFAFDSLDAAVAEAARSAAVTHDHPEGIKGAQATVHAIVLARQGAGKAAIRNAIAAAYGYDLNRRLAAIRPGYGFDVSCQGSVPESLIAFLESDSFEGSIRNAVSLGGDADTMACIAGGVAQAHYGTLPSALVDAAVARLPSEFLAVIDRFHRTYLPSMPALASGSAAPE